MPTSTAAKAASFDFRLTCRWVHEPEIARRHPVHAEAPPGQAGVRGARRASCPRCDRVGQQRHRVGVDVEVRRHVVDGHDVGGAALVEGADREAPLRPARRASVPAATRRRRRRLAETAPADRSATRPDRGGSRPPTPRDEGDERQHARAHGFTASRCRPRALISFQPPCTVPPSPTMPCRPSSPGWNAILPGRDRR